MPYSVLAQSKPNFSGTWTLDAAKSDPPAARGGGGGGAPGGGGGGGGRAGGGGGGGGRGGGGPVTITQTATDITIGMQAYKLDGSEATIEGRGGSQKVKAAWEGATLAITTVRDVQGTTITSKAVRSLSADGMEMTVVTTTTGMPQGGGAPNKQVFTKSM
jgi:hypothetical protein